MAQSLGLPGQPNHPQVQEAYARATEKIHAAGKHWLDEVTESLSLFMHTRAGLGDLLRKTRARATDQLRLRLTDGAQNRLHEAASIRYSLSADAEHRYLLRA